jgi:hypothetical protein
MDVATTSLLPGGTEYARKIVGAMFGRKITCAADFVQAYADRFNISYSEAQHEILANNKAMKLMFSIS